MKEEDGLVGDRADQPLVEVFASPESAAVRAGRSLGGVATVSMKDLGSWVGVGVGGVGKSYNGHGGELLHNGG
jgi:hypothetical protein